MLMTLILVVSFRQQNFSNNDIDIINFVRRFQSFIGSILTWCLNIMSGETLLLQGLSEPKFYGDLVFKFRKLFVIKRSVIT